MELIIVVPLATDRRTFEKGEKVFWPDKADAQRLIKAGHARPAALVPSKE
jgi:hypothetical protein